MKKIIIFTEEFNLQEVCVKDQKDEKDRKREVQVERNIVLLMFSTVSSGDMAVMATNILSNAVFHIIEGNIVNHKICVRYLR